MESKGQSALPKAILCAAFSLKIAFIYAGDNDIISGEFGKLTKEEGRLFFFTICLLHLLNLCCVHLLSTQKIHKLLLELRLCELCPSKAVLKTFLS